MLVFVDVDYTFLVLRAERLKLEKDYLELQSKAFAAPGSALVEVGLMRAQSHEPVAAVSRLANVECATSHVICAEGAQAGRAVAALSERRLRKSY
jgi:hypothetical protein